METSHRLMLALGMLTGSAGLCANPLPPGGSVWLPDSHPQIVGTWIDSSSDSFYLTEYVGGSEPWRNLNGNVETVVTRSTTDNTLNFYWRVTLNSGSDVPANNFFSFSVENFLQTAFSFDVGWVPDNGASLQSVSRIGTVSGGCTLQADCAVFDFPSYSQPFSGTSWFFLDTDATQYDRGGHVVVKDGMAIDSPPVISTFRPVSGTSSTSVPAR